MTRQIVNPETMLVPRGPYAHGLVIDPAQRWLMATGQVAIDRDGHIPDGAQAQSEMVWQHVQSILASGGMTIADIVKTSVFVTSAEAMAAFNVVRNRILGDHVVATTAVIVPALANPAYLVEVEFMACCDPKRHGEPTATDALGAMAWTFP
jgi:enamine deaminase RidA (YjgF/YER057c/UK114 family)